MKNSKVLHWWNASGLLFFAAFLLNAILPDNRGAWLSVFFYLTLILFLTATVVLGRKLRCPHCGKFLHPRDAYFDHCPQCGEKIN